MIMAIRNYNYDTDRIVGSTLLLQPNIRFHNNSVPLFLDYETTIKVLTVVKKEEDKKEFERLHTPTLENRVNRYNKLPWYKKLFTFNI